MPKSTQTTQPQPQEEPIFLDVKEAASFLKIPKSSLYHHTSQNVLKFYKPTGRKILFLKKDLVEFILQGTNRPDISIS